MINRLLRRGNDGNDGNDDKRKEPQPVDLEIAKGTETNNKLSRRRMWRRCWLASLVSVGMLAAVLIIIRVVYPAGFQQFRFGLESTRGIYCSSKDARRDLAILLNYKICPILNNANVTYWLKDGTLLGAIREGGNILKQDTDGDLGYFKKDNPLLVKAFNDVWHNGIKNINNMWLNRGLADLKAHTRNVRVLADGSSVPYIDRDSYQGSFVGDVMNQFIDRYFGGVPEDWILPVRKLGGTGALRDCMIPNQPEKMLASQYGAEFMEKVPCIPGHEEQVDPIYRAPS